MQSGSFKSALFVQAGCCSHPSERPQLTVHIHGITAVINFQLTFATHHAGALNFRDVMLAYGKLSKQQMAHESGGDNIGFEFSGTTVRLNGFLH